MIRYSEQQVISMYLSQTQQQLVSTHSQEGLILIILNLQKIVINNVATYLAWHKLLI